MDKTKQAHENEHVKQDAHKLIARQRRGEILVASSRSNYWPLPCLHDVPGVQHTRGGYTSPWGDFSHIRELSGVCVFHPAEGNKRPPVWKGYDLDTPLALATAIVDPTRRWARIVSDDGGEIATLADVPVWEAAWRLLNQVREMLVQARVSAVVWRLAWREPADDERPPLWADGRSPLVRNDHAAVNVAGYAYDGDDNLVYLSAVGHKTALEAIRASLVGRHRKGKLQLSATGYGYARLNGLDRYEQVWAALPDFAAHHVAFLARQALKPEPTDGVTYLPVFANDGSGNDNGSDDELLEAQAARRLARRLHEALPIPVLGEWADALWEAAQDRLWLSRGYAGGDCCACWRVSLRADWAELVEDLLSQGAIEISI
ncbi:MAG: hypothetical protein PVF45_08205 [Anaerolineae bacterium]